MIASQIERDILIEAPPDVVWRVVTEADQLQRWYCDAADIDLRPGGVGVITFKHQGNQVMVRISVVSVDPPRLFSYRWTHPEGEEARPDNSTLVEFTLTPESNGTRLRVIESGLDLVAWPDEQKAGFVDDHGKGWDIHMVNLGRFMAKEQQSSASL